MNDILVIGIAGGSGSGKTTLCRYLADRFGNDITVINHDDYYKEHHSLTYEERTRINYDHPEAFDNDLFIEHLGELKNGNSVECPVYDYKIHDRSDEVKTIVPTKVILVDGILIFADERIRSLMDIKIFVETDDDIRIIRRITRDVNERRRTLESVINQYVNTVKPMHELFVQPSRKFADIIIPEGGRNNEALRMIADRIASHLKTE